MAGDWSDLTKRVARGLAEVKKTTGSELLAESLPVPLADGRPQPAAIPAGSAAAEAVGHLMSRPGPQLWTTIYSFARTCG